MMWLLSKVIGSLGGSLLTWVTIPALCLTALTAGKIAWDRRDARLIKEGERICDARWEQEVRDSERKSAQAAVDRANELLAMERRVTGNLQDELDLAHAEAEKLRAASDSTDPRCLSDGVLDSLKPGAQPEPRKNRRPKPKPKPAGSPGLFEDLFGSKAASESD